jgi:type I restriction enzyme S subunit
MVPEGWKLETVGDICDFINGNGFKSTEWAKYGLPIIRIQNLNGSCDFNYFDGEPKDRWIVNPGDILFAWAGTKGVSFGAKRWGGPRGVLNQHIFRIEPKRDLDREWLYLALRLVTQRVEEKAHGFKATLVHVQKSDITEQNLHLPPLPEQKKIAQILSTWDQAITANERLLENSQQQKKALIQQLLTGKKRLPGFDGTWEEVTLGSLFHRVTTRNEGQSTNVVTISGQQGLIRQQEFFKKSVASETLDNYFLLKRGQFAYNKSYSNGYPMGAIKRLNRYEDGVVTTLYICFELADERTADSDFYEQYFESGQLIKGLMQIAHEGARAHGLLNVKPSDFFSLKVHKPPIDEQKAIARLLVTTDRELQAHKSRLEQLKIEKKALMQQLLTGKRRVKLETEAA